MLSPTLSVMIFNLSVLLTLFIIIRGKATVDRRIKLTLFTGCVEPQIEESTINCSCEYFESVQALMTLRGLWKVCAGCSPQQQAKTQDQQRKLTPIYIPPLNLCQTPLGLSASDNVHLFIFTNTAVERASSCCYGRATKRGRPDWGIEAQKSLKKRAGVYKTIVVTEALVFYRRRKFVQGVCELSEVPV